MATEEAKIIRVQIHHPVMGTHNFQLHSKENFSDLRLLLSQNTTMTIFQNFRFELNGQSLPQFQEIGATVHNQSRINLTLQPFDEKSSFHHFERVRELLANPLDWIMLSNNTKDNLEERELLDQAFKSEDVNIDNFLDRPLTSNLGADKFELLRATPVYFYETLAFSHQVNPPLTHKKLAGDFYYIQMRTLEGSEHLITAGPQGFSVSHGSQSPFIFYNLLDLFKYISPKFSQTFNNLRKSYYCPTEFQKNLYISHRSSSKKQWIRSHCPVFYRKKSQSLKSQSQSACSFQWPSLSWSYSAPTHPNPDHFSKDSFFIKDWNEIIQIQSISSEDSPMDVANKEKNRYKIYQDFVIFAKETAVKVIEGLIPPVCKFEGGDSVEHGIYQYGSVVVWIAEEEPLSYMVEKQDFEEEGSKKWGGSRRKPRISRRAINTEIKNLQHLFNSNQLDLGYRHTVLVRYRGYSIVVQTVVPGLPLTDFLHEQLRKQSSFHNDRMFFSNPSALRQKSACISKQVEFFNKSAKLQQDQGDKKLLEQIAKQLKLSGKNVYRNDKGDACLTYIHPKLKAIEGIDHRQYLLNLYTLSPRDINFSGIDNSGSVLRRELLERYESGERRGGKNVFCSTVGTQYNSMIDAGYRMVFSEKLSEQYLKLKTIKAFIREKLISDCLTQLLTTKRKYLADSKSVVKIMHENGLSSRYLGMLCMAKPESKMEAPHLKIILERVILVKTLKSIFQMAMRDSESIQNANGDIRVVICRLLNSLFCVGKVSEEMEEDAKETRDKEKEEENSSTTISKKKKKKQSSTSERRSQETQWENTINTIRRNCSEEGKVWTNGVINPKDLSLLAIKVAEYRFGYQLPKVHALMEQNVFYKTAVLRDICLSLGIVLEKNQYFEKEGQIFKPQNVIEVKPLAKHIKIHNQTLKDLIERANMYLENKKIEQAIQAYNTAINYTTTNFGLMNEQLAFLNKKIAEVYFRLGEIEAAILFMDCSAKIFEKIHGLSDVETLECYNLLSQFYFFKRNFELSESYMLRMIQVSTVAYGEEYPELIAAYLNLSSIYEGWMKCIDSIACVTRALEIVLRVYGETHINTAVCYSAMSAAYFQIPDISRAIHFQKKAIEVMKSLGVNAKDARMKESVKILEFYQNLQSSKKVRENHEKEKKKLMNTQLYSGLQLMRFPDGNQREREWKMQQAILAGGNLPMHMLGGKGFMF